MLISIPYYRRFSNSQLFVYMQSITSFLAPPITAVFILAVFHKRTNEPVSQEIKTDILIKADYDSKARSNF